MFDYQIVAFEIDYVDIFCTKKASGFVFKHQFFLGGVRMLWCNALMLACESSPFSPILLNKRLAITMKTPYNYLTNHNQVENV
jgi:hypothetical protein